MKKIAYISGRINSSDSVRSLISEVAHESGARFLTIDKRLSEESLAQAIWRMLKQSDVVIADSSEATPSLIYEIGLSHGLRKPVLILSPFARNDLPSELAGTYTVKFERHQDGLSVLKYRISQVLHEHFKSGNLIPAFPFVTNDATLQQPVLADSPFERILGLRGRDRIRDFETWFLALASGVPDWEVMARSAHRRDAYEAVIWNSSEDSDLAVLGNPIPVELKAVDHLNTDALAAASQRAQLQRLRGLIFATTAQATDRSLDFVRQVFAVQNFAIAILGQTDLKQVSNSNDLTRAIRSSLRAAVYGS